jgi:DNA (cytosine-5)-methyltransferase 1
MRRPIAIDLFSGCGGMSLGLEAAGFNIAGAVELDPIHSLVHHFNFPYSATICKNIRELETDDLIVAIKEKGFEGEIDLIAGGPPCQGFSQIGKRQLDDPRNSLVFEYLRVIKDLHPKYFIFENVPGIVSGKHKKFLDELINEFENIGYQITKPVKILDASLFGAPQKRNRLIILGNRKGFNPVNYSNKSDFIDGKDKINQLNLCEIKLEKFNYVGDAISDLENITAFINNDEGIDSKKLDYSGFRKHFDFDVNLKGIYSLCHRRQVGSFIYGHLGSKHTKKSIQRFLATQPGTVEKTSRFFKLAEDGFCNTLRAGTASDRGAYTAPRPIHYNLPRCITVREAARLHTFPDWFQFHNTIWHGFREIGNAVIPFLSYSLGLQIIEVLNIDSSQLKIMELEPVDRKYLSYNMKQACEYWNISTDVISSRKRVNN